MNHSDDEIFGRNIDQLDRETPRYNLSEDELEEKGQSNNGDGKDPTDGKLQDCQDKRNGSLTDIKSSILSDKKMLPGSHKPPPSVASVQPYSRIMSKPIQTTVLSPGPRKKFSFSQETSAVTSVVPPHQFYNSSMYTKQRGMYPPNGNTPCYQSPVPLQHKMHMPRHTMDMSTPKSMNQMHSDMAVRPPLANHSNSYLQSGAHINTPQGNSHQMQRAPTPARTQSNAHLKGNLHGNPCLPSNSHVSMKPHSTGNPPSIHGHVPQDQKPPCYCTDCVQPPTLPPTQQLKSTSLPQQLVIKPERQRIEDEILLRQRELDSCWQEDELDCPRDFTAIDRKKERCYAEWTADDQKLNDPILLNRETKTSALCTSALPTSVTRDHLAAVSTSSYTGPIIKTKAKAVVSPLPRALSQKRVNINTVVSQFSYPEEAELPQDYSNPAWPQSEMGSRIPSSERISLSPLCMSGVPSGIQTPVEPGQIAIEKHTVVPISSTAPPTRSLPTNHSDIDKRKLSVLDKFKGNELFKHSSDIPLPPAADSIKNYASPSWPQSEMGSRIPSSERISLSPLTMSGVPSGIQTPVENDTGHIPLNRTESEATRTKRVDSQSVRNEYSQSVRSNSQSNSSHSTRSISSDVIKETKNQVELPPDPVIDDSVHDFSQFPQSELTSRVPSSERIYLSPLCQSTVPSGCQTPEEGEPEPYINENGVRLRSKKQQQRTLSAGNEKLDELMERMHINNGGGHVVPRFDHVEKDQIKGIVTPCDHSSLYGGAKPLHHNHRNASISEHEASNHEDSFVDNSVDGVSPVDEREKPQSNVCSQPTNEINQQDSWSSAESSYSNRTDMSTVVNAPTSMHNTAPASPDPDGSEISDSELSDLENMDGNSELPASYSQPISPSLSSENNLNINNRRTINHRPLLHNQNNNRLPYENQCPPNPDTNNGAKTHVKNLIQMAKEQFPKQNLPGIGRECDNKQSASFGNHVSGVYPQTKPTQQHHKYNEKLAPQSNEHHAPLNEHHATLGEHRTTVGEHRIPLNDRTPMNEHNASMKDFHVSVNGNHLTKDHHAPMNDNHPFNAIYNDDKLHSDPYDHDHFHHDKTGYHPRYPLHSEQQFPLAFNHSTNAALEYGYKNMMQPYDYSKKRMRTIPEGHQSQQFQRSLHPSYFPPQHRDNCVAMSDHYTQHQQQRVDQDDDHMINHSKPVAHALHPLQTQDYFPHGFHGDGSQKYLHQTHVPHPANGHSQQQPIPQPQNRAYSITSIEPNRDSPPRSESLDTESVISFASMAASNQNLDTKADMMSSLLSMLGTHDPDDMARTLLAMSSSPDSCAAMRQSGCLPLIIQLLHNNQEESVNWGARQRAGLALHNIVHSNRVDRRGKREIQVLRLLEIIRTHSEEILSQNDERYRSNRVAPPLREHGPGPAVAAIMKLSFAEEHKNTICELGGLQTVGEILAVDYMENNTCHDPYAIALRKYAGMVLINLTFNDSKNKTILCLMTKTLKAITGQLCLTDAEDLVQVYAGIIRNISWRPDDKTQKALQKVNAIRALLLSIQNLRTEVCIRTVLSAVWNLSAHNSQNKEEVCRTPGSLKYLAYALKYRSPSNTFDVVENAGGILRNVSSHIALNMQYRRILRQEGCLQTLVAQLRSPSTHVISNSCGVLWNLSARCVEDQQLLWDLGAVSILKTLIHVKHKSISAGAAAALRNLLAVTPGSGTDTESNMSFQHRSNSLPVRDRNRRQDGRYKSLGAVERKKSKSKNDGSSKENKKLNYASNEEVPPPKYADVFGPSLNEMHQRQPSPSSQMFFPADTHNTVLPDNRIIYNQFRSSSSCSSFSINNEAKSNGVGLQIASGKFSPTARVERTEEKVMTHSRNMQLPENSFLGAKMEESSFIDACSTSSDIRVTDNDSSLSDPRIKTNPYEDSVLSQVKDVVLTYTGTTPKLKKKTSKKEKKISTPRLLSKTQRVKKSIESLLTSKDSLLAMDSEKSRDDKKDGNIWIKNKGVKQRVLNKSHSSDLAFDKNVNPKLNKKSTFELYSMAKFPERVASDQCLSITDRFIRDNLHGHAQADTHHVSWSSFDFNHCNEEGVMMNRQGGKFTPNVTSKRMINPYSYPEDDTAIGEHPYNFPPKVFNQPPQHINSQIHSSPYLHSLSNSENTENENKKSGKFKRIGILKNPLKKSAESKTKKSASEKQKVKEKR